MVAWVVNVRFHHRANSPRHPLLAYSLPLIIGLGRSTSCSSAPRRSLLPSFNLSYPPAHLSPHPLTPIPFLFTFLRTLLHFFAFSFFPPKGNSFLFSCFRP